LIKKSNQGGRDLLCLLLLKMSLDDRLHPTQASVMGKQVAESLHRSLNRTGSLKT